MMWNQRFSIRQVRQSLRRFWISCLCSIVWFLLVVPVPGMDALPIQVHRSMTVSLICTAGFAVFWQLICEYRRLSCRWQGICSIWFSAVFALLYTAHTPGYAWLYAAGITGALMAASLSFLSRQYGDIVFQRLLWGVLKSIAFSFLVFASLAICAAALNMLAPSFFMAARMPVFYFSGGVVLFIAALTYIPVPGEKMEAVWLLRQVVSWVLFPLYLLFLLILYAYIVLITVQGSMPVGQMNWFASLALAGAVFFVLTCRSSQEMAGLRWFVRWGGLALLPVVAVQLWGVAIRYEAYGLSVWRYASMLCTLYALIVLSLAAARVKSCWMYGCAAVCCLLASVTPLNIYDLPYAQQLHRLTAALQAQDMLENGSVRADRQLPPAAREPIVSAYQYLQKHTETRHAETARHLLQSPVLQALETEGPASYQYVTDDSRAVPLTGYTRLYAFDGTAEQDTITIQTETESLSFFLGSYVDQIRQTYGGTVHVPSLVYAPDSGHLLYFRRISVHTDREGNRFLSVSGYLLVP